METFSYWWLKVSTWYYTNVGIGYYGYQLFSWWIVDSRERVPSEAERMVGGTDWFHVGPFHVIKQD